MRACVPFFALLAVSAFSQTITGTVEGIDKDRLRIKGRDGVVTVQVDERTVVRKAKAAHDLSVLAVGDEVRAACYGEGTLTAVNISAKVTLSGVITESRPTHLQISVDSPPPADRKASVFVALQAGTKFLVNRSQLTVGRRVQIAGWDSSDGVMDADKVTIDETDSPKRK